MRAARTLHTRSARLQEMLVSGLLHDTVEDTDVVSLELIGELFGAGCRCIVEGETKFSKLSKIQKGMSKEDLKVRLPASPRRAPCWWLFSARRCARHGRERRFFSALSRRGPQRSGAAHDAGATARA